MTTIKGGEVSAILSKTAELGKKRISIWEILIIPARFYHGEKKIVLFTLHRIPEMQNTYRSCVDGNRYGMKILYRLYGDYYRFFISDGDVPSSDMVETTEGTGTGLI